jgi:hypothetical protein
MLQKLQVLLEKSRKVLGVAFLIHVVGGLLIVIGLALAPPVSIGEGGFDQFVAALEQVNFQWWLVAGALFIWILPIAVVATWRRTNATGLEIDRLQEKVLTLLEGRSIPVTVDIDERIPVSFDASLSVPVGLDTDIDLDSEVEIQAEIPVRTELPLDTKVETSVFGIGKISIPIKATIPLDFVVPIDGALRIKATELPIQVRDNAEIELPPIEVPLKCRVETRIDLLSNIEASGLLK